MLYLVISPYGQRAEISYSKKVENIELHNCARPFSFGERIKRNLS